MILIEVEENVTLVFKKPMRALLGLGIGSPLSAGGAILGACFTEVLHLRSLDLRIRSEILTKTLIRRWLDDLLIVALQRLSAAAAA